MREHTRRLLSRVLSLAACAAVTQSSPLMAQASVDVPHLSRVAAAFAANCSGCHGHLGKSVSEIPTLAGRIGYFTRIPEGRAYLAQVPGVASSAASDAEIAGILNWLLLNYSREQLPADFNPYTAEEVGRLRIAAINPWIRRAEIVRKLVAGGYIPSAEVLSLEPLQLY